jgi:outer membrane receptor protein involved in Fe transport
MAVAAIAQAALAVAGLAPAAARADDAAAATAPQQVLVIGTTLLPGSGVELRRLPANAQVFSDSDLRRQGSGSLTDFLTDNATGLTLNAAQGNPYQPDINLRGFSASPLIGTPQGISVFMDGMRINEPFGDSVNWDLIPTSAIASIELIPGSNPAFGLNTLGGAIAVYTKSGSSAYPDRPGGVVTLSGGSFGRRAVGFEAGGVAGDWDWFVTGNDDRDSGWAEHNRSQVRRLFAKAGWLSGGTDLALSVQLADNVLEGTQTLPPDFTDIRQAYTWPDINTNRVAAVALKVSQSLASSWLLSGNAYVRQFRNTNYSSNANTDYSEDDPVQATNDASAIDQTGAGAGLQLSHGGVYGGFRHQLAVGASIDTGRARYTLSLQDAVFTADRSTQGLGAFVPQTDAESTSRYAGVFVSDSISLDPHWALSLAGRFNRADTEISDRSGTAPELNGSHRFERFNPAIGLSFNPNASMTVYAAYNEGMRAPTAVELTCADPDAPCRLPNSFLSDPPLKMVVSTTLEAGARGKLAGGAGWSLAVFRTDLHDDLQFVSSSGVAANAGYFQNVGTTRRQGVEVGADTRLGRLALALHYGLIDATYRSAFSESSPSNSTADAHGAIEVRPGNRIPGVPRQSLKLRADLTATAAWNVGLSLIAADSVYARGDENNRDANGRVGGWTVVNLDTLYELEHGLSLFARVDNLFNRVYANFGILGQNIFTGPGWSYDGSNPVDRQFRGHGAPRGAWAGLQYRFD